MAVIEVSGAHKTYRRWRKPPEHAVRGLDLTVEPGGVFGFLGPNGSGKTTTIRLLLGLVRPDAGSLKMLGRSVPTELPLVIGRVGALVETPLFFPNFSAHRNLSLLAGASKIPAARVAQMLELVGLTERADDRVKGYSLGMKQRLGSPLLGFGIANLIRNTAAAFGAAFVYFAIVESALRSISPATQPYLFTTGLQAWVSGGGIDVYGAPVYNQQQGSVELAVTHVSNLHGGLLLLAYAAVLLAISLLLFRRRDIS